MNQIRYEFNYTGHPSYRRVCKLSPVILLTRFEKPSSTTRLPDLWSLILNCVLGIFRHPCLCVTKSTPILVYRGARVCYSQNIIWVRFSICTLLPPWSFIISMLFFVICSAFLVQLVEPLRCPRETSHPTQISLRQNVTYVVNNFVYCSIFRITEPKTHQTLENVSKLYSRATKCISSSD